jgi:hypothetical protein
MYAGAMDKLAKVQPFPVDGYKLRAKDFTNPSLVHEVIGKAGNKPVYVSVPHDEWGQIMPTREEVWKDMWTSGVYTVYCRPEYPPKNENLNLHKSLTFNGVSLHSNDWLVHALACAMHVGYEETRPKEHNKRFYVEVHVMPTPGIDLPPLQIGREGEITFEGGNVSYTVPEEELTVMNYGKTLDQEVSIFPRELSLLRNAINVMEETIG